jgi:uncharacterized protein
VERQMALQVTTIMLGVEDLGRSKAFYGEGLGCKVEQDYPGFVLLNLGDGSSSLALYPREAGSAGCRCLARGVGLPRRVVSLHR